MPAGSNLALKIVPPSPPTAISALVRLRARLLSAVGLRRTPKARLYVVSADGLKPVAPADKRKRARSLQMLLARLQARKLRPSA